MSTIKSSAIITLDRSTAPRGPDFVVSVVTGGGANLYSQTPVYSDTFPLWHRTDLPDHERRVSAKAYARLRDALEHRDKGKSVELDLDKVLAPSDDDDL